jgi:hypothetical protein
MEVGSLTRVKHILEEFGDISGLECNVEKTILMQIGSDLPIEQEIKDLGFDVKSEITLLGLTIENDTGTFGKSFGKITTCIQKEINFWNRFYLSLPGRIAVAKAMLYSQLNYLGNFLPLENLYTAMVRLNREFCCGSFEHCEKQTVPAKGGGGFRPV